MKKLIQSLRPIRTSPKALCAQSAQGILIHPKGTSESRKFRARFAHNDT